MYIYKNLTFRGIIDVAGFHMIWLTVWAIIVACIYKFTFLRDFNIPWLPISIIGTAVAFYVGFKNNQAYDRYWEARKIWGSIINTSRMWGSNLRAYIRNWNGSEVNDLEIRSIHKTLIYRHITWIYTLRQQLLIPMSWEHLGLNNHVGKLNRRRSVRAGVDSLDPHLTEKVQQKYLQPYEQNRLTSYANKATQLIDFQSQQLAVLREQNLVDDFRHVELVKVLNDMYDHQGKAERIKRTPLPRQYASVSFILVCIFIFIFPFGMVSEFNKLGAWGVWLSIPFTAVSGWVFVVMELVGDYTENPFEGLSNDIPMYSICRTIEIDLLQMLEEQEIPKPIQAVNGVQL